MMHGFLFRTVVLALSLGSLAGVSNAAVIVTDLEPGYGAAGSGLREGDLILEWTEGTNSTAIDDPLRLHLIEILHSPRGEVTLTGERAGEVLRWILPPIPWGITTEPRDLRTAPAWRRLEESIALIGLGGADESFDSALASTDDPELTAVLYIEWSREHESGGDRPKAQSIIEAGLAAFQSSGTSQPLLEAQLLEAAGTAARLVRDLDTAEKRQSGALELRIELAPGSCAEAASRYDLHLCAFGRGELETAAELGEQALAIYESLPGSGYFVARTRSKIGRISLSQGDHETARVRFESALEVFIRLDPAGADVGEAQTNLGILARRSGDLEEAAERFEAGLAIYEAIDPGGRAVAMLMNNLGSIAFDRGDLLAAEYYIDSAMELAEVRDAGSMSVAIYLNNLAGLAMERGDLARSEELHVRALAIRQEQAPAGLDTALSLENLGMVSYERGDLERSEVYFDRSLEIVRAAAPGGYDEARVLQRKGQLETTRGEFTLARDLIQQSMNIRQVIAPDGVDVASSLVALADADRRLGQYSQAEAELERALEICDSIAPGGLKVASYRASLSRVYLDAGNPAAALPHAERSLEIRQTLIPGSYWEAISWRDIGRIHRAAEDYERALDAFLTATGLMDELGPTVGSVELSRMRFRARHADIYRDCVDARIRLGDVAGALEELERSRSRSFLVMLGQRDLQFTADLPAGLLSERRRNRTEYDRALSELVHVASPEEADALSTRLADLAEGRDRIAAEVARQSPDLDALERPRSWSADEIIAEIPGGTVLVAYSSGPDRTHGIVAGGQNGSILSSFTIEVPRAELEAMIREFRHAIEGRGAYEDMSRELHKLLIAPIATEIEAGTRLLLSPDGPLHLLPFAALLGPTQDLDDQFLAEWRPVHFTGSIAVQARQRRKEPDSTARQIVVFADPGPGVSAQTSSEAMQARTRNLVGGARELGQLTFAREEAAAIETLYGDSRTTVLLGAQASERRVKELTGPIAYVHFACHGIADQADPLNSALLLSEVAAMDPGDENGVLQSWEVLESVRFDADLVTLSACETALGADMGGEGLVSLVRAFQYAGARAVLASLWQVADQPTAELMKNFYGALKRGMDKDAALRDAQSRLLGSSVVADPAVTRGVGGLSAGSTGPAHPFYWAGFQLYGDPATSQ